MWTLYLAGLTAMLVSPVVMADEPTTFSEATKKGGQPPQAERPIAHRFREIRDEYEQIAAYRRRFLSAAVKAKSQRDKRESNEKESRDLVADFSRRMVDLAESSPGDPAARDALLWVIGQTARADFGAYGDQFGRAGALLVRHHGDDPEAIRIGLSLDNWVTPHRDSLLLGFYSAAKGREARGLARLALAQYLVHKTREVVYARSIVGRPKFRALQAGKVIRERDMNNEQYANLLTLRHCDPQAIQSEAVRLFEEVIAEYGDVAHITRRQRVLEASVKDPTSRVNGRSLTDQDRRLIESKVASKKTLGEVAVGRLDELFNLVVGKLAPKITGVDVDGKKLELSDSKGKVSLLVFWGSWCAPCMQQLAHEKELAAQYKDRPFIVLGVECGDAPDIARKIVARERISWPNWYDGDVAGGPIATLYRIRHYPSVFLLDAKGVIRSRGPFSPELDALIETLVNEAEHY